MHCFRLGFALFAVDCAPIDVPCLVCFLLLPLALRLIKIAFPPSLALLPIALHTERFVDRRTIVLLNLQN